MRRLIPGPIKTLARRALDAVPVAVEVRRKRPRPLPPKGRFHYQSAFIDIDIKLTDRVLDIGSGADPFPHATVLVERFLEPSRHRHALLVTAGKPLVMADIECLPFGDRSFDFVYCSHLLEHVDHPVKACSEIMRVGRRGYIETPTFGKDSMFAWAKNMHKWHVTAIAQNLCFFEYSERQVEGIRSAAWHDIIYGRRHHPLQDAFWQNQDIFNTMLVWEDAFSVFVFRLDGSLEALRPQETRRL